MPRQSHQSFFNSETKVFLGSVSRYQLSNFSVNELLLLFVVFRFWNFSDTLRYRVI